LPSIDAVESAMLLAPADTADDSGSEHVATSESSAPADAVAEGTAPAIPADPFGSKSQAGRRGGKGGKEKQASAKRMTPRQRRRRWLMALLKPLENKKLTIQRLTAFQLVMVGRALRSNMLSLHWEYDKNQLLKHVLKHVPAGQHPFASLLAEAAQRGIDRIASSAEHEAWVEQTERAQRYLTDTCVSLVEERLNQPVLEGQRMLVIDAVGQRTAPTAVISALGEVEHCEDLPCQLSPGIRQQMVVRLGELVHQHRIDTIAISNGPARRTCLVALRELLSQSQPGSLRWLLADRNGSDQLSSDVAHDHPLRRLPRRFRAAAWIGHSLLDPVGALLDPQTTKLRVATYQRELSANEITASMEDLLRSYIAQRGLDINSAPVQAVSLVPGLSRQEAEAIDAHRRKKLYENREELTETLEQSANPKATQSLPYLRVFASLSALDGTPIAPEDYRLADRFSQALQIASPPSAPAHYVAPNYAAASPKVDVGSVATAATPVAVTIGAAPESFGQMVDADPLMASTSEEVARGDVSSVIVDPPAAVAVTGDGVDPSMGEPSVVEPSVAEPSVVEPSVVESAAAVDVNLSSVVARSGVAEKGQREKEHPQLVAAIALEVGKRHQVVPPAEDMVRKLVKEWQVGSNKAYQIVQSLTDPFAMPMRRVLDRNALQDRVPTLAELTVGDIVCGVVIGIADFGVFVELGPECSGLVHASRVTRKYLNDPHERLQVGDVVRAWVAGIEPQRKRVALSIVPLDQPSVAPHGGEGEPGGRPRGGREGRGDRPVRNDGAAARGDSNRGEGGRGEGGRGDSGRGESGRGEQPAGAGNDRDIAGRGRRGGGRAGGGGRPPGGRPDGRGGQGRGKGKEGNDLETITRTVTVRVAKSNKPIEPISNDKKEGKEPLRSFSDLMQFYQHKQTDDPAPSDGDSSET
jgi:protein Tex